MRDQTWEQANSYFYFAGSPVHQFSRFKVVLLPPSRAEVRTETSMRTHQSAGLAVCSPCWMISLWSSPVCGVYLAEGALSQVPQHPLSTPGPQDPVWAP